MQVNIALTFDIFTLPNQLKSVPWSWNWSVVAMGQRETGITTSPLSTPRGARPPSELLSPPSVYVAFKK